MRVKHRGSLSARLAWLPPNLTEHMIGIVIARSMRHGVTLLTSGGAMVDVSTKNLQTLTCEGTRPERRKKTRAV